MEIKVLKEKENPLFKRKEVKVIIESNTNPSSTDAEKIISEKFSSQQENITIKSINGKFGRKTFLITANIYSTKQDKEKTEPKQKIKQEIKSTG